MGTEIQKVVVDKNIVTYRNEMWEVVRDMIVNQDDVSLLDIARTTNIPLHVIEAKALSSGWLNKRDIVKIKNAEKQLNRVMGEISLQLNDANAHVSAFIESVQFSHRIKIIKNDDGTITYRNFEDFPGKPERWDEFTDDQKDAILNYIAPSRLTKFWQDLMVALNFRFNILNFIARVSKASLPKISPDLINMSNRGSEKMITEGPPISDLLGKEKKSGDDTPTEETDIDALLNKMNEDNKKRSEEKNNG